MINNDNIIKILILEDDLEALSVLMKNLYILEKSLIGIPFVVTVFSEYTKVDNYLNKLDSSDFDIILLDRDCKMGGSFHILDFKKFDVNKIISISSIPKWNDEAVKRGVKKVYWKDHNNIEDWGESVIQGIKKMVIKND